MNHAPYAGSPAEHDLALLWHRSDFPTAAAAVAAAAEGAHVRSRSAQKAALRRSLSAAPRSSANSSSGAAELVPPSTSPEHQRRLALHSASSVSY